MTILCLGAHCDDIEIGCGGSLLKILNHNSEISVHWQVFSSNPERSSEAKSCAEKFLRKAKNKSIHIQDFRDGFLPDQWREVKESFEMIKREINPDIIFTHCKNDQHQDHKIVSELTWNTFRNHLILEYEILKFDGDIGNPNIYIPVSDEHTHCKISYILESFKSQNSKSWFTEETFRSLMRIRGMEINNTRYAEAFYGRKIPIG